MWGRRSKEPGGLSKAAVETALSKLALPGGGDPISRDLIRAIAVEEGHVRFVVEAPSPEIAKQMEPFRKAAEAAVAALDGVVRVSAVVTAHGPAAPAKAPPQLKFGGHAKPQKEVMKPAGVASIVAIGSGKGGVGKSTVSANLAVAAARAGLRVGLLDADIYGPSQPRMFGITKRAASPDGKTIEPIRAHGVTVMSIGMMVDDSKAVVWRGPMLMGALQQMLMQVAWGDLDVLFIDLPPGTGDVVLTLGQKSDVAGAIIVSTPQDVALIDARKAIDAFRTLKVPLAGLVENMAFFCCPSCGTQTAIFGSGGVQAEAARQTLRVLAQLPIDLETREAGDGGQPVALGQGAMAQAYADLVARLRADGVF